MARGDVSAFVNTRLYAALLSTSPTCATAYLCIHVPYRRSADAFACLVRHAILVGIGRAITQEHSGAAHIHQAQLPRYCQRRLVLAVADILHVAVEQVLVELSGEQACARNRAQRIA